ncbi:iron complex transport system ATP-binding protein [Friedmanniella endophytica]|uniref:Iron complex transport system ATP-binding protein n=1 Tax=Microlunatus kandeliicorticis TaxID=1759536 RepID=A0A7W3IPY3_9ACTN|nr:ABC transporter ATP-binding protein [Microlunatus kandeliicorticis]MBA8793084.1 iron complex transport system ATP-binding protein [Microlunatus kandeliicorticis]
MVADVEAGVPPGLVTAVIGPNGAGKSTLLRTVLALQPALGGRARLDGDDLAAMSPRDRARRTAVLLTERVDVGLLTGREVVELGRHPHHGLLDGRLDAAERGLVESTLDRLDAREIAGERLAELSDGQRQRILLARALVQDPRLLVLDEPSAFLDVGARVDLLALLAEVAAERGLAVLMSTHEVELALRTDARVLLLDGGRATSGTPAELIASGAIARAFGTAGTRFDRATRTFVRRAAPG